MRKIILIPFLLPLVSCVSNTPTVDIEFYQVYEGVYCSGIWDSPRFDTTLTFKKNETLNSGDFSANLSPSYSCYGDGYYWIVGYFKDIGLTKEIPHEFKATKNMKLYYGCRG